MTSLCFTERRTVSRKTQRDGKLEITATLAGHILDADGPAPTLAVDDATDEARVISLTCACDRSPLGGAHHHFFLESELLKRLPAGHEVTLRFAPSTRHVDVLP